MWEALNVDAESAFPPCFSVAKAVVTVVTAGTLAPRSPLGKLALCSRPNRRSLAERRSKVPGTEDQGRILKSFRVFWALILGCRETKQALSKTIKM